MVNIVSFLFILKPDYYIFGFVGGTTGGQAQTQRVLQPLSI